jgi:divalent metal cation (Fe/Co/Zn/Cd) transporter
VATAVLPLPDRDRLVRRARFLAWVGITWHFAEAAIAIGAGLAASSIALIGFGIDSLIETLAGFVVLWRFAGTAHPARERRAQRLVALSFYVLAAYVGVEAVRALFGDERPGESWVGIGLAAFTVVTMPMLAAAKGRVARALHSHSAEAESRQTVLCAYLSGALLIGLGGNALFGLWWLDPVTALVIAAVAVREGRAAWRGEDCC